MNYLERFGIEPHCEPVNPQDLFKELVDTLNKLVILQGESDIAIALWIFHTYLIEKADQQQIMPKSPVLSVFSPDKQCGKSTLKEVIAELCPRPELVSDFSNAVFYRTMEAVQPTMLIDEADNLPVQNHALLGILNSGYSPDGVVKRMGGKTFEDVKSFSTWGAKAMFGIGNLPDTLSSRCIHIPLKRKTFGEKIASLREFKRNNPKAFTVLRQKILRFTLDSKELISNSIPGIPSELSDRAKDCWEPLLMIADVMGNEIFDVASRAAVLLTPTETNVLNTGVMLLEDILQIFDQIHKDSISSQELIYKLTQDETKLWCEYERYRPISPRQVADVLRTFSIKPKDIRFNSSVLKGYEREDFKDAFARYLPQSATELQNSHQ